MIRSFDSSVPAMNLITEDAGAGIPCGEPGIATGANPPSASAAARSAAA